MTVDTLGKYKLGVVLGQGGMGAVYRSFHPQLNRPVAIKVIRSNVTDPQAHQRFIREAQIVAGLAHPHIIRIFDIDVQDGQPYIVMDFVEGESLDKRLSAGPLSLDIVLQIMLPLTNALGYAHSQGVIHRDLKPANVLLRPDGSPVLADFGIARPLDTHTSAQLTATGALIGTLAYIAPEQFLGTGADQRSDIYALGIMLFEMLTGHPPFDGDTAQIMYGHLHQPPPSLNTLQPTLPKALDQLVQHMLAKEPDDRPQTAAEISKTLLSIKDTLAFTGPTIALTDPPTLPVGAVSIPSTVPVGQAPATTPPTPTAPQRPWLSMRGCLLVSLGAFALTSVLVILILVFTVNVTTTDSIGSAEPSELPYQGAPSDSASSISEPIYNLRDALPFQPFDRERLSFPEDQLQWRMTTTLQNEQQIGPELFTVGNMSYAYIGDSLWFFGEVRNDGETPRESVMVRISLLNEDGQELASDTGFTSMSYLNPGEISPFQVLFSEEELSETPPTSYVMEVRSDEADFELGYTIRDITIVDEPRELRESSQIVLRGSVYNEAEGPTQFVNVKAIFYDTDGAVVGIGDTYAETDIPDDILPPGENGTFDMRSIIFTGIPTSYRLMVEGSRVSE
ncbi:MAG: protein kinase [Chloroflexota bacterium]